VTPAAVTSNPSNPIVSIDEVFQWSISEEGDPVLAYAGSETNYKDGTLKNYSYSRAHIDVALSLIAKNDTSNITDYNNEFVGQTMANYMNSR
jgi:hypothetical protein